MLFILLFTLFHYAVSNCSLNCIKQEFTCLSLHLNTSIVIKTLDEFAIGRFSVCKFDETANFAYKMLLRKDESNKDSISLSEDPSVMITFIECNEETNWKELSIVNRRKWNSQGCLIEYSLLLVLFNGFIRVFLIQLPPRSLKTDKQFEIQLKHQYTLEHLKDLLEELNKMEYPPSRLHFQEHEQNSNHLAVQDVKEHWPNWAIYLVIVCVLLTALAFLLGNCITKRNSPLRLAKAGGTKQTANPIRRNWGAGFSGGLWAAG